jgi:hypothetical protein
MSVLSSATRTRARGPGPSAGAGRGSAGSLGEAGSQLRASSTNGAVPSAVLARSRGASTRSAGRCALPRGIVTVNVVPRSTSLSARIVPPWRRRRESLGKVRCCQGRSGLSALHPIRHPGAAPSRVTNRSSFPSTRIASPSLRRHGRCGDRPSRRRRSSSRRRSGTRDGAIVVPVDPDRLPLEAPSSPATLPPPPSMPRHRRGCGRHGRPCAGLRDEAFLPPVDPDGVPVDAPSSPSMRSSPTTMQIAFPSMRRGRRRCAVTAVDATSSPEDRAVAVDAP